MIEDRRLCSPYRGVVGRTLMRLIVRRERLTKIEVDDASVEVSDDSGVDHFPLKETRVAAEINGVIASVHVHQRYRNEGTRPLNARYIFPGSTGAAVNAPNARTSRCSGLSARCG